MDLTITELRVVRTVAERGSFTAAAADLGYTQSAVSRQVASVERQTGRLLFDRRRAGVRPTNDGLTVVRRAIAVLDQLDALERDLSARTPAQVVRLGAYLSAGAAVLPRWLPAFAKARPDVQVTTREGTTPALVRALRAGSLDLAILAVRAPFRPPDDESPRLVTHVLAEAGLLLAVPAAGRFAGRASVDVDELSDAEWIASPPGARGEPLLGVWPGLAGRPVVAHTARDWLTKLRLVAAGCGVTTVPANLLDALPAGVATVTVHGGVEERRRMVLCRLPGPTSSAVRDVITSLRDHHRA